MLNSIKNYLIKAKVKDPSGAETVSTPISLKVSNTAGACRYTMPPIVIADTSSTTIALSAKGCLGTTKWSDDFVGTQRTISRSNTIYTATCELPYECLATASTNCLPTYSTGCNGYGISLNGVTINNVTLSSNSGCGTNGYTSFATPVTTLVKFNKIIFYYLCHSWNINRKYYLTYYYSVYQ